MDHVAFTLKNREGHVFRVRRRGAHLLTKDNQRLPLRQGDLIVYLGKRFSNRPFEHFTSRKRHKFTPKRIPQWQQETEEGLYTAAIRPRISDNVFMFITWNPYVDWWSEEAENEPRRDPRSFKQGYFQPAGKEDKFLIHEGFYDELNVTRLLGMPKFLTEVPGAGHSHFEEEDDPLYRLAMKKTAQELEEKWFEGEENGDVHPLSELLAFLRAMFWSHQTTHWQMRGTAYYGDHLLFQRLYEAISGEIDTLAEKIVGNFGEELVNAVDQADLNHQFQELFSEIECPFERGLIVEQDFQVRLNEIYDAMKADGSMTMGLDDFIMGIASTHETHIYLLQQRLKEL